MSTNIDRIYFMVSPRLGFGTWGAGGIELAMAIWGDAEVTALTGGPFTPAQVSERLGNEVDTLAEFGLQYWPVFALETGDHIGCCGLRPRQADAGIFEFGFQLRREAWGRGFAFEAGQSVSAWGAKRGLSALIAGHHPENHASGHTLEKLGFVYTHDEFYEPTTLMEPCYRLELR